MTEFRAALHEYPMSLQRLQSCVEHAFVDCHDVPPSLVKLDVPLVACCDRVRVVNAIEEGLGVITIGNLSKVGRNKLLEIRNIGELEFSALHDDASIELGEYLLSRDLDDRELSRVLKYGLVSRGDLRGKTRKWLLRKFPKFGKRLISLRGASLADRTRTKKHISDKLASHLKRLNQAKR